MSDKSPTRDALDKLITAVSGQNSNLTIPRVYITLTGGIESALLLSQIVYWTDRTTMKDGWFAKSYDEWKEELTLSKYQVMTAVKKLKEAGVQTSIKKFNGAPTVHYKLDREVLSQWIVKKLNNPLSSNLTIDNQETPQSSTETTAETTTEINTNTSATSAGSFSDSHEVGTQPAASDTKEPLNAFEGFVSTLDIDTAAPLDRIPEDELEPMPPYEEPPLILHECKETDIAEMIAAWWEWVPLRPALRGKPSTLADHMKIPTNRDYARNLFERGIRPIDFVRVLNGLRLHPPTEGHKEMPFQYVCPMVDAYVAQNRPHERGAFTEQDPRWAAKKPGTACVYLGENLWERKDLFIDLAPRYFSIAQLTKEAEENETYAPQPSEFDTWTAEDWEKDGNPL